MSRWREGGFVNGTLPAEFFPIFQNSASAVLSSHRFRWYSTCTAMFPDYRRGRRGNQALHRFIPYFYERGPSSSRFFFFTLIQDFSIKIVFTCCNSISYSIRPSHFYVFTRKIFAFISHFRLCVSPSFVNGMNSSYFFFFFLFLEMKFYFQFNSGTGDQTEKNHASLRSFNSYFFVHCAFTSPLPLPCKFLNLILIRTGFAPSKKEKFLFKLLLRRESLVSR